MNADSVADSLFDIIEKLPSKPTKINVLLLFLEEIGGMIHHLESVGCSWGAGGEEDRAFWELVKYKRISKRIKDKINDLVLI